jgi:hypothetical protein
MRILSLAVAAGLTCLATLPAAGSSAVLPFIEDDYDRALAEARARKLPMFVEAWAPW